MNEGSFGALQNTPASELIEAFIAGVTALDEAQRAEVLRLSSRDQPGSGFAEVTSGATVALVLRDVLSAQQFDLLYRSFNKVLPAERLVTEARLRAFLSAVNRPGPVPRRARPEVSYRQGRTLD